MPRATTRLSSTAIADIWARRLLEMKIPANFEPSRLERDVSLTLRIEALVKRLPDAPLSEPLRAALVGMNVLPNAHATDNLALSAATSTLASWLKPLFEHRKLVLAGNILDGLRTPALVCMAIEKTYVQLRSYPDDNGQLEVALESLLDRALPMFAGTFVPSSWPQAPVRNDGFTRQTLTQLLALIKSSNKLEQAVSIVGQDAWVRMCRNLLDPTTGGTFLLGENKEWLESSMRRVGLLQHVSHSTPDRAPQRRM